MANFLARSPWSPSFAASVLLLIASVTLRAEDWPQFRGPNRDGAWPEEGLVQSFPAAEAMIRWRASIGPGYSSPVVAQGHVYVSDVELMAPHARERVLAFDVATGRPRWSHARDVAYPDWVFTPEGKRGPTATPVVQDGKLFTVGSLGDLLCLNARTGEVLWEKELAKEYKVKEFSTNASPLIEGDLLILFIGGQPKACVVALDKNSGKEIWKSLDESVTNSSPIVVTAGGRRQLIVWTQESVTSLNPRTGETWWRQRLLTSSDYVVSTPVYSNNRLLIGGLMMTLDPDEPHAEVLWPKTRATARRVLSNTSTALIRGDHVFSARSSGELICLEASTGDQLWKTDKVTDVMSGASMHLTDNGDSVLIYNERGELIRAQLTPEGYHEISRAALVEPTYPFGGRNVVWPPAAYANGHFFARSDKELVCASLVAEAKPY
jgi:outer membrane protein assembly factor BamB